MGASVCLPFHSSIGEENQVVSFACLGSKFSRRPAILEGVLGDGPSMRVG